MANAQLALDAQLALTALADPTRRHVFERLASGPAAVGEIAAGLPVSRPAVSQHLKALKQAGLVIDQAEGTRRVYRIDPAGLGAIRAWLDQFWGVALDAFKAEVERKSKPERSDKAQRSDKNLGDTRK
jgi:DNA-binding transcriptional ArsR family regulator